MDFTKKTEKNSYRIGKAIGFLFSYTLFTSMTFYMLTKFHKLALTLQNYIYALLIALIFALIVFGIKKLFKRGRPS